jgi:2-amino-4-hydroxy-6-hydroxymethyldihydropteridine diphosphokinase
MTQLQRWIPAYIGVGSNLDDPEKQVRSALDALRKLPGCRFVAGSPLYCNPPMGPQDQPDYVNAVAALLTRQLPEELLLSLQKLESNLGRVRSEGDRWGPRVIDLDLLIYGVTECSVPGLDLPHPGISERNFVLFPLRDIAPLLSVPGQGTVEDLARQVSDVGLVMIEA